MCGGRSLWVPCSRVSHVYRGHSCSSCGSGLLQTVIFSLSLLRFLGTLANKFKGVPTTLRNYKRVIEVWFDDEYKEFFYTREPLARLIDPGDLSDQLKLKKDKKCKSFDWFMKEIAYDVFDKYPKLPPNKNWGEMKNAGSKTVSFCFPSLYVSLPVCAVCGHHGPAPALCHRDQRLSRGRRISDDAVQHQGAAQQRRVVRQGGHRGPGDHRLV